MAEGITLKRIIDMDEAAELTSSDYALVDSATGGPKKFALGNELSSLKDDISTKIGFENDFVSRTMFETGRAVYTGGGLAATRRWFVNHVFAAGTYVDKIKWGFNCYTTATGRICNFEIWKKNGDTLTKDKTVTVDVSQTTAKQEVGYATAIMNYESTTDFMICVRPEGSISPILYTVDPNGNDNMVVSTDVTASTSSLSYSSLSEFTLKVYPDMEIDYSVGTKVNVVLIGEGMDYEEIQDALLDITDDSATNPYTLYITPKGIPYKPFSMLRNSWTDTYPWDNVTPRYISIIGMDKAHCVIQSDSGDYRYPCAELITNGIIKNLTFVMTNDQQNATATKGGYCLHVDCRTKNDVGYDMRIEDCDMVDASGPCLGIGIHKNCTLTIRRCNLHTTLAANYAPHQGYTNLKDYGVIFCHTSTRSDATNQKINIEDCVGLCDNGNKGLQIAAAGDYDPSTASFYYRLIRNVFWNATQAAPSYSISGSLTADPMNYGNNIPA